MMIRRRAVRSEDFCDVYPPIHQGRSMESTSSQLFACGNDRMEVRGAEHKHKHTDSGWHGAEICIKTGGSERRVCCGRC